jgi:RNA polymerase sigma-70 factor (ECF subfamily)
MHSSAPFDDLSDGELLLVALGRLNASDREILKLSAWDDLDRRAIAAVLGISENATDQRLHRARSRLRVELGRVSGGPKEPRPKEAST